jgi:putative colanic acid biosynthesis acetyltransferase WcaF
MDRFSMNGAVESRPQTVDVSRYASPLSRWNKLGRALWGVVWLLLFRPSPRPCFAWRRWLLRCFGARMGKGANVYSSCRVWAPWNLEMGDHSCLGFDVDCYCVDRVRIGAHATVSQYSYLCTASHDIRDPHMRLVTAPIAIGNGAWVCAGAFVGPGVVLGEGAVAAARAVVVKDVEPWAVVGGNPARFLGTRELR